MSNIILPIVIALSYCWFILILWVIKTPKFLNSNYSYSSSSSSDTSFIFLYVNVDVTFTFIELHLVNAGFLLQSIQIFLTFYFAFSS